jgi:catechol 2,3-dioxygenase-like lactoylglutathione lyase family enzyme
MKFTKLTPSLVVHDVQAAVRFYQSILGFQPAITVPDSPPYVFASVTNGAGVEIFFNDQKAVGADYPRSPAIHPEARLRSSSNAKGLNRS